MPPALAPRFWGVHVLMLVLVGIAGWLGAWQLEGWQERRTAEAADRTQVDPLPLAAVIGPDQPFPGDMVGQPVIVDGTWLPEDTVFVSGREHRGREGYWVVTPLLVDESALPVVRGWAPSPGEAPGPPTGAAEFVAWLQPPEGSTALDDADPDDDVLPELRVADLAQRLEPDLYGGYAVVAGEDALGDWPVGADATNPGTSGLAPASLDQLPPVGRFTAFRNLLYALEWWVFGAFAVVVWWRYLRDALRDSGVEDPVDHSVPSGP